MECICCPTGPAESFGKGLAVLVIADSPPMMEGDAGKEWFNYELWGVKMGSR